MTQIEALMLVALGFFLAMLLVFAFGRSVWSASNLYARMKREKDMPAAMMELQADRDKLRADNARMASKLEAGTEAMAAQVVTQKAEVARHRNRLLSISDKAGANDEILAQKIAENIDLSEQVRVLSAELDVQQKTINQLRDEVAELTLAKAAPAPLEDVQDIVTEAPLALDKPEDVEPAKPELSPAMARAVAANDQTGRSTRFNFERRALPPVMERTMRRTDLKDVIDEARRSLSEDANVAAKPPGDRETVLGFAQRIRDIQKKHDAKINKTLK